MLAMLGSLIGPVSDLLDKAIPDKDLKEKLAHDIATMAERHTNEQVKAHADARLKSIVLFHRIIYA